MFIVTRRIVSSKVCKVHTSATSCPLLTYCVLLHWSHPLIPKLRECIHDDTEHNVQSNGSHNDEERDVKKQP